MKIIAGSLKGKRLIYPKGLLRATTNKIRGVIFNIIEAHFPNLLNQTIMCDLFAGAGAVGIEAISRGVRFVTFIEHDRKIVSYLRKNLNGLEDRTEVIIGNVLRVISQLKSRKFDIIFLDAPYNKGLIEPVIKKIIQYEILDENGIIIIEHSPKEKFALPERLILYKRKNYTDTVVSVVQLKTL